MQNVKQAVASAIEKALSSQDIAYDGVLSLLETPSDAKLGDLAFPCFRLAKFMHKAPPMIASSLQSALELPPEIEKVEVAGAYLNFFLAPQSYAQQLEKMLANPAYGKPSVGTGKTVCLDFSSPNIAKHFHLGHIGTTVIGNALRNLFAYCGYRTVAINYLGDWGTQFGKLIVAYRMWSSREAIEKNGIDELEKIYVRFNQEAENNPSLNDEARAAFHQLELGNEENLALWRYFREISLQEYQTIYDLMGISFDSYNGESFFTDKMPAVVEELKQKNLLKLDDGASVVDLSAFNMPPALILKRDGSTLYPTRDIAAALWRKKEYNFDLCVYVTSAGQSLHFAQWFKVVELMGYDWAKNLVHVPYGTMSFGGEKLASRTGNIIHLKDLLQSAIDKTESVIEEKNAALLNKHETAVSVGVGAIIFNALAGRRINDTNFIWEQALSFDGNSGPYLQYSYARASSILRKADLKPSAEGEIPCAEEINLIKLLSQMESKVLQSLSEYEPSVITRYALELCSAFNLFYHECPILKADPEQQSFRLALTAVFRETLGTCLTLLGMKRTEEI